MALDAVYAVEDARPWWKQHLTPTLLTLGVAVFIIAAFTVVFGGPQLAEVMTSRVGPAAGPAVPGVRTPVGARGTAFGQRRRERIRHRRRRGAGLRRRSARQAGAVMAVISSLFGPRPGSDIHT